MHICILFPKELKNLDSNYTILYLAIEICVITDHFASEAVVNIRHVVIEQSKWRKMAMTLRSWHQRRHLKCNV